MKRLTLDMSPKMDDILTHLARGKSMSKAEVLRRAVALYNYVEEQLASGETSLTISNKQDEVIKEIVVP
jgi:hypothetical protein